MRKAVVSVGILALAGGLMAAQTARGYRLLESLPAGTASWPAKAYEKEGATFASGSSARLVDKEAARLEAIRNAAAKAAEHLSKKGLGGKRELKDELLNTLTKQRSSPLASFESVKLEGVVEERWASPEGRQEWRVRVLLVLRPLKRR